MRVWLTSSGIDVDMGGIASVTRSCLVALVSDIVSAKVRFIRLRSPAPGSGHPALEKIVSRIEVREGRGNRLRFLAEVTRQVVARPDLVIHEHVDLAQCQTMIPSFLRRPYAVWGHGIELWRPLPRRKEQALREADALIFNSAFTRRKAGTFHPWILERPYFVLPLCREGGGSGPSPATGSADLPRKSWILTVGRLHEERPKGHREILAALPALSERVPDLHWHVVGSGPWLEALESMVEASPARNLVTLHGFLDKETLERLYVQSRVFAMPSQGEGFGLVYAEAMAHGLPCVGSTLDAASEVIGTAGACLDPEDGELLLETLAEYLLATPETFQAMSEAARERAAFFEIERFAADLETALGDLVAAP
jgi:phosphatidylinositol alpha-1,6-mannosyltransferase